MFYMITPYYIQVRRLLFVCLSTTMLLAAPDRLQAKFIRNNYIIFI